MLQAYNSEGFKLVRGRWAPTTIFRPAIPVPMVPFGPEA